MKLTFFILLLQTQLRFCIYIVFLDSIFILFESFSFNIYKLSLLPIIPLLDTIIAFANYSPFITAPWCESFIFLYNFIVLFRVNYYLQYGQFYL